MSNLYPMIDEPEMDPIDNLVDGLLGWTASSVQPMSPEETAFNQGWIDRSIAEIKAGGIEVEFKARLLQQVEGRKRWSAERSDSKIAQQYIYLIDERCQVILDLLG